MDFYPRSQHPSTTALAPDGVNGVAGSGTQAEWDRHLHRVLPELAVHDRARELRAAEQRLDRALRAAPLAGMTWSQLEAATSQARLVAGAQQSEELARGA